MAGFLTQAWIGEMQSAAHRAEVPPDLALVVQQVVPDGSADGEVAYTIEISDGRVTVSPGRHPRPDVTFVQDRDTAASIASGTLSAQSAFIDGRLRLEGDLQPVLEQAGALAILDDLFAPARAATRW